MDIIWGNKISFPVASYHLIQILQVANHIENAKDAAKQAKKELREKVDELKEEVEETIVEFTDSLKEKLLSPQVREAIDTIEYLIGKPNFTKSY